MSKVMAALAALITALTVVVAAPMSAQAAGGCVSKHEYNAVHAGMTRHHVARIFDTNGRITGPVVFYEDGSDMYRAYRACLGSPWSLGGDVVHATFTMGQDGLWHVDGSLWRDFGGK